jgi:hypothetical protein
METQTQVQAPDLKPVFGIHTGGSCGYSEVEVIYPEKINLKRFTSKDGVHEVDLGVLKIRYRNYDSRKNLHRDIEVVEVREPIVIRSYGRKSCSKSFDNIYVILPPNVVKKLEPEEIKEELVIEENGKYRYKVMVRYVEINGARVVVEKTVMEKEPILQKLEIKARVSNNTIEVYGDTFHIREILKELKFKWDPVKKIWYTRCSSEDDVNYMLLELEVRLKEKNVNLVIEGVKNE